jgi:hypothetical protein
MRSYFHGRICTQLGARPTCCARRRLAIRVFRVAAGRSRLCGFYISTLIRCGRITWAATGIPAPPVHISTAWHKMPCVSSVATPRTCHVYRAGPRCSRVASERETAWSGMAAPRPSRSFRAARAGSLPRLVAVRGQHCCASKDCERFRSRRSWRGTVHTISVPV